MSGQNVCCPEMLSGHIYKVNLNTVTVLHTMICCTRNIVHKWENIYVLYSSGILYACFSWMIVYSFHGALFHI